MTSVRKDFAVREDGVIAYKMQEEESKPLVMRCAGIEGEWLHCLRQLTITMQKMSVEIEA